MMAELPSGTVTFLFTDLEGSTRLWEDDADAMRVAVARHDVLLEDAITRQGGVVFSRMSPRGEGGGKVPPAEEIAMADTNAPKELLTPS